MRKIFLAGLFFFLAFSGIGLTGADEKNGYSNSEDELEVQGIGHLMERLKQLEKEGVPDELESVLNHFRNQGLKVDDVHFKLPEMMGAEGGIGFNLEGGAVELYLFDPAKADNEIASSLEKARQTGTFFSPGLKTDVPVKINGNIMLTGLQIHAYQHPAKDRIIEVFENY